MTNINFNKLNDEYNRLVNNEILQFIPENLRAATENVLEDEKKGNYRKAAKECLNIILENSANSQPLNIIFARIFLKVIEEDVEKRDARLRQDFKTYFKFLDNIDMDEVMQQYVVETLIRLSAHMEDKWFRPFLKSFANRIDENKYLKEDIYKDTIFSVFASIEACEYNEDKKVSDLMKNILKTSYHKKFTILDENSEEIKLEINLDALTNEWYACRYFTGHEDEFNYVKDQYPYSYKLIDCKIVDLQTDRAVKEDELLQQLMEYVDDGIDMEKLKKAMESSYEDYL